MRDEQFRSRIYRPKGLHIGRHFAKACTALSLLTSGLLSGCEKAQSSEQAVSTAVDGQFQVVSSTGTIAFDTLVQIGVAEGPREYAFGRVDAVLPRPAGGFFTCDGQDIQIRRYDASGRFIALVGRSGAGPAEYEDCRSMLLNRQNEMVVNDVGNGRLVMFDLDGEYKRVQSWVNRGSLLAVDSAGRHWTVDYRAGRGGDERSWNVLTVRNSRGAALDSLELPSLRLVPGTNVMIFGTSEGLLSPRTDDTLWAVLPTGGTVVAASADSVITLLDADRSARVLHTSAGLTRYGSSERREWEALITRSRAQPQQRLPEVKPRIRELRGDEVGRVWVRLADSAYRSGEESRHADGRPRLTHFEQGVWELLDGTSGEILGKLRLPIGYRVLTSRGDAIWLTGFGDEGHQQLLVIRLRREQST